jgi:hypothetical protein
MRRALRRQLAAFIAAAAEIASPPRGAAPKRALKRGREKRRWWSLSRDIAQDKGKWPARYIEVIEKIATDRTAGYRHCGDFKS